MTILPTTTLPTDELNALLTAANRLERLVEFIGCKTVETTLHCGHEPIYPKPDPWVMGYSIETENRGCYRFVKLAEGTDRDAVIDAGLDAWDKETAKWAGLEIDHDD